MKNVKKYSHDYTLAADANFMLFAARKNLEQGYIDAAKKNIDDAREMLNEYLAADNMVEDNDCYPGWVKAHDVEREAKKCRFSCHICLYWNEDEEQCEHPDMPPCND